MRGFAISSSMLNPRVFCQLGFRLLKNPSNPMMQNMSTDISMNRLPASRREESDPASAHNPKPSAKNMSATDHTFNSMAQAQSATGAINNNVKRPYRGRRPFDAQLPILFFASTRCNGCPIRSAMMLKMTRSDASKLVTQVVQVSNHPVTSHQNDGQHY